MLEVCPSDRLPGEMSRGPSPLKVEAADGKPGLGSTAMGHLDTSPVLEKELRVPVSQKWSYAPITSRERASPNEESKPSYF